MSRLVLLSLLLVVLAVPAPAEQSAQPWPAPVPGHVAPKPGEHPRLLFRKADIPALRERAATPRGRKIVQRLRMLLGNDGQALPDAYNTHFPVNIAPRGHKKLPVGAFTNAHAAGYGMLYQLTGEKKYAALARQCLERMFDADRYAVGYDEIKKARGGLWRYKGDESKLAGKVLRYGQPDRDERYTWTRPGAKLRIGPMMAQVALAYDLCYDAWDPAFRKRVVREIVEYNHTPVDYDKYSEGHKGPGTMDRLVHCSYPPRSNHFGAYIGGAGFALLAIRGDDGADEQKVEAWLGKIESQAKRLLTEGFGDHGYFAEGHGPSHMAVNTAFVPFLQAARTAWGKDFVCPRPNAQWLTLRWVMEAVPDASGKAWYPNYHPSSYGPDHIATGNMSDGGEFSQGFGALANDDQRAALLWLWNRSHGKKHPEAFDAWIYPHRAVFALVNWPLELPEKNPAEVIGHAAVDQTMGHYMFRKGWAGPDDVYFSFLLNPTGRRGYVRSAPPGRFAFYGLGLRTRWGYKPPRGARQSHYEAFDQGLGGTLSFSGDDRTVHAIAVDYSDATGAAGVVVFANPWFSEKSQTATHWRQFKGRSDKQTGARLQVHPRVTAGGVEYLVLTAHRGQGPRIRADNGRLRVGNQTYRFDGKKIHLGD